MTKKKRPDGAHPGMETLTSEVAEEGVAQWGANLPGEPGRWGYGFEKVGAKWRAYKTGPTLEYLTPLPGRELHHVISQIQAALSQEVATATRGRK